MRVRTDDGVELAVEVAGTGPVLLMVHGHGGAKEDFSDHVAVLAESHTVAVFDHRGHGASDKPDEVDAYSLERLAEDVLCVVDALGADRFRLLGHSMGGMVARHVLVREPDRVEAMIFMNTCAGPIEGWDPEIMEVAAAVAFNDGKEELKAVLDAFSPLNNPAFDRLVAERPGYQEFCDRKWDDVSAIAWGALMRSMAHQSDHRDELRAAEVPTLVLVGELDAAFLEASREISKLVPDAQLEVFVDAGHSPQMESALAWRDALRAFLSDVEAASDQSSLAS